MYCINCGNEILDGTKPCPNCGDTFVQEVVTEATTFSHDKIFFIISCILSLIIITLFMLLVF